MFRHIVQLTFSVALLIPAAKPAVMSDAGAGTVTTAAASASGETPARSGYIVASS